MWSLTVILLEPGSGSLSDLTERMKNVEVEDLISICLVELLDIRILRRLSFLNEFNQNYYYRFSVRLRNRLWSRNSNAQQRIELRFSDR